MSETREHIHYKMQQVKNKNSQIELMLRRELWKKGYRYRKHYSKIEGHPDIVFVSKKIAIFCDSEFWHGFDWERRQQDLKVNKKFWIEKIERNIERDKEVTEKLEKKGWLVLRFWGNDIKKNLKNCVTEIENAFEKRRKECLFKQ